MPYQMRMCRLPLRPSASGSYYGSCCSGPTEGDDGDLNPIDWQDLANLYDIHAPISVIEVEAEYPADGVPFDTPDASTSSAVPSE